MIWLKTRTDGGPTGEEVDVTQPSLLDMPKTTTTPDRLLRQMQAKAGAEFRAKAESHMLFVLGHMHGRHWSGETLTQACRDAGIIPPGGDDRHFGPVFRSLSQRGLIKQVGWCSRQRGHGSGGGRVWARV